MALLPPHCFYTGVPEPAWLERTSVPLCVSYGRLRRLKHKLPRSPRNGSWFLDSRGFQELHQHGEWTITPRRYVLDVIRYDQEIGNLTWAASQDSMCEETALAATGSTVLEHQHATVDNYLRLRDLWVDLGQDDWNSPFMPTLQGDPEDNQTYLRCWDLYDAAGIDLQQFPVVGLGSVCKRQADDSIGELVTLLQARDTEQALPLHGFGCKQGALAKYLPLLGSADSQAWSLHARYHNVKHPGCDAAHRNCNYCLPYALAWRERVLAGIGQDPVTRGWGIDGR